VIHFVRLCEDADLAGFSADFSDFGDAKISLRNGLGGLGSDSFDPLSPIVFGCASCSLHPIEAIMREHILTPHFVAPTERLICGVQEMDTLRDLP
jgi:hypothetical protein